MVNFNGEICQSTAISIENNRAFLYGDGVFETIRILDHKILFLEEHYFRLMASMRILRMEIPMAFTMEYFQEQIMKLVEAAYPHKKSLRVRITCYRNGKGLYYPEDQNVGYLITASEVEDPFYVNKSESYEMEIYKDFYVSKHLLSTLKTTNRLINITASIFAKENDYQNCFLINEEKNIVEAINANVFLVIKNTIVTPPLSSGCMNGIMRKQIIQLIQKQELYTVEERNISPFELQKADEIFLTNTIMGIQSVTKYRKTEYKKDVANKLLGLLNAKIRFS